MIISPYSPDSPAPSTMTGNPARDLANSVNVRVILFLLLHMPLAMLMEISPWFSTIHAAFVLVYGIVAGLTGRTTHVLFALAYIASCEVLWRMSQAHLVWEYAKYAMVVLVFIALVAEWRLQSEWRRIRTLAPIFLLVVLLPGAIITIFELGISNARDPLSFNLAGYLAMIMMALYFWKRPINQPTAFRLLMALLAPVVGITFLAIYYTARSLETLDFVAASNWITSGSYGPNQVSNMMGLGALVGTMLFILMPQARAARIFILVLTIIMLGQGLLTFSRGGIYSFVIALAFFGFHLMGNPRTRRRFIVLLTLFSVLLIVGIYPYLDNFTGGVLSDRFSDLDTTGRLELAQIDMQAFASNPVAGVGVGQATQFHEEYFGFALSAHTEFTRLLAEHGMFGIIAILILGWMIWQRYKDNQQGLSRAMTAAFAVWAISIMFHSAMRLASVSLIFSLALVMWQIPQNIHIDMRVLAPIISDRHNSEAKQKWPTTQADSRE
jgi:hypothetical protein